MAKQAVESPISLPYNDQRLLHLETPRKHLDETILQEISKKYILIPKLRPTLDDYITDIKPKLDDTTDWKSKYQILEQLKRDEKEQDSPTREEIFQADPKSDESNINYMETTTKEDIQPSLKYIHENNDHILSENQLSYNLQSYPNDTQEVEQRYNYNNVNETEPANDGFDNYKNNIEHSELGNTLTDNDINGRFDHFEGNEENNDYDHMKSNENNEILEKSIDNYEYIENEDSKIRPEQDTVINEDPAKVDLKADASQNNVENEYNPVESNSNEQPNNDSNEQFNTNQETYLDREEVTFVENVNANNLHNVINNDIAPNSDSNEVANTDYPIETIDVKDFTPHDDVQLVDGVNINPEPQVLVAPDDLTYHYDPIVETSNITDPTTTIDAEQSQEFYNEQVDQNYDYTEEGVADKYNAEYTAPNENYEQNEYAYYEGAQTEQVYPEANDNEETSQRYDQNYEQQYGATYDQEAYPQQGYEQSEYSEEQMQHYEAQDQTQQDLGTMQYEQNQDNLNPQNVEQQLDHEQGYAEKQDENIEITNVEEQQNLNVGDL